MGAVQPSPFPADQDEEAAATVALDAATLAGLKQEASGSFPRAPLAVGQQAPEAPTAQPEEEEFYEGKTQAMELKPATRNADGTYSCAYCSGVLPPDVKATCPHCGQIVIGL